MNKYIEESIEKNVTLLFPEYSLKNIKTIYIPKQHLSDENSWRGIPLKESIIDDLIIEVYDEPSQLKG